MNETIKKYIEVNRFGRFLGMDFEVTGPGEIIYRIKMQEDFLATENSIHGGVIAAFSDAVLSVAALSAIAYENKRVATIEFKINFFKPVSAGEELEGRGKVIQKGNKIIIAECEIYTGEKIRVSKSTGTFMSYPASSPAGG